jgi:amino acid permease
MVGAGVLGLPYAMSELGWCVRAMTISTCFMAIVF